MSATHGGKGSKQRPTGNQKKFDNNWDAIFGKKKDPPSAVDDCATVTEESAMWEHYCTAEATKMSIAKGQECSWCGMTEK